MIMVAGESYILYLGHILTIKYENNGKSNKNGI